MEVNKPLNKDIYGHIPVLEDPVEKYCELKEGDTVIDCTLGLGGHSELFLKKIGEKGTLIAFEADERNLKVAQERLKKNKNKIIFIHKNFVLLHKEVEERKIKGIKCIFFDLGLASTHVDEAGRGFSFLREGPLDMRFDQNTPLTAEKVLNKYSEKRLALLFKEYGEERYAKKYARIIKDNLPIKTTTELASLIEKHAPKHIKGRHPATRIFQALRIEVNNELDVLQEALQQAIDILEPGGRLMVISYHSLEDRIVKRTMKIATRECICPKEQPICICNHQPQLKIITKKPITPTLHEMHMNSRSRSAKLRVAEKLPTI